MPVQIQHQVDAKCEACLHTVGKLNGTLEQFTAAAKKEGWWITSKGKAICPSCLKVTNIVEAVMEEETPTVQKPGTDAAIAPKKDEPKSDKPQETSQQPYDLDASAKKAKDAKKS